MSRIVAIRESVQGQEFRMAEGIPTATEPETQDRKRKKEGQRGEGE